MIRLLTALLTVTLALPLAAKEVPARFVAALQRALDADATWTMTKTLPALPQPLRSAGTVSCWKEKGMVWKTLEPWEEEIRLTKETMTFLADGDVKTTPFDEMPYYADICEATDAFLAGETDAFDDLFDWHWQEEETGSWTMTLEVNYRRMRRLFKTVTLRGGETLTSVSFVPGEAENGTVQLHFTETGRAAHTLWTFESDSRE